MIQNALNETFSAEVHVRFESAPDLVSGIELTASGQKVGWSIDGYLASLQGGIDDLLKEKAQEKAKDDKAKDDKAKDDKAKDDKAKDAKAKDDKSNDDKSKDDKSNDGNAKDDKAKDDKAKDDKSNDGKAKDGKAKDDKPEGTAEPTRGAPEAEVKSQ